MQDADARVTGLNSILPKIDSDIASDVANGLRFIPVEGWHVPHQVFRPERYAYRLPTIGSVQLRPGAGRKVSVDFGIAKHGCMVLMFFRRVRCEIFHVIF